MRCIVYNHHIYNPHDSAYNIDSDLQLLREPDYDHDVGQTAATDVNYTRLNLQQWNNFLDESKGIWNTLDNDSEDRIIEFSKPPNQQRVQCSQTHTRNNTFDRKVQFHDLEETADSSHVDLSSDTFHDALTEQPTCHPTHNDCAMLADMKTRHQLPPGYLERFLLSSLNANQSKATAPSKAT